jgi:hypothetical protein
MPIAPPAAPPVPTPGLTQAALDYITQALIACGSQSAGESVSAEDAQSGLQILNQMMDLWNSMELMIFTIQRLVFNLVANQQTYAVGSGGDFNIPRPPRIERYSIITNQNPQTPLELVIEDFTLARWQEIPVKTIPPALPLGVWDDKAFPNRNLNYWPPPIAGVQAVIYPWIALSYFPDLVTQFTFPPAYAECIKYNLAFRYMIEFPGDMERAPLIKMMADQGMELLKSFNTEITALRTDSLNSISGRRGFYNFYSDTPAGKGGV